MGKTTKTEKKLPKILCTGAVGELGQFVQCRKQNAPLRTNIFCPHSHLSGRIRQTWRMPWWSWLTSTSTRTTSTFHRWITTILTSKRSVGIPHQWQKIITSSQLGSPLSDENSSLHPGMYPPKLYPSLTIQYMSAARRAAEDLVIINEMLIVNKIIRCHRFVKLLPGSRTKEMRDR